MADGTEQEEDGATRGHNVNEILQSIATMNERAYGLEQQIETAVEKHVKPLKDELKKLYRNTKADTLVPIKVLKAHYKLYEMAREAEESEEEEAAETLDGMRLAFEALQHGQQLDWLTAVEVTHAPGGAPRFVREPQEDEAA